MITKALDSTSDAIGISDLQGCHIYQNRAFSKLFEFKTVQELCSRGSDSAIFRDKNTLKQISDRVMDGKSWSGELFMESKSKRIFPAFVRIDPIRDENNNITGFIKVITDWTGHNQTESALLLSRQFFESMINGIAAPLFVKDENHRWIVVNDALGKILGHSCSEMLGKSDYDLFPKEQADVFWAHDDMVLGSDKIDINEEKINGIDQVHTISTIKSSFINPITGKKNIVATIRDITKRKQTEENLRQSEAQLAERVKELNCLFRLSSLIETPGISMEKIMRKLVLLIPQGFQYPDITCARLVIKDQEYKTDNYQKTPGGLFQNIVVSGCTLGSLEVGCLADQPEQDDFFFLNEEKDLIKVIAQRLQHLIDRYQTENILKESEEKHRLFFENSPLGIIHYSAKGFITSINDSAVNTFGSSRKKLVGLDLKALSNKILSKELLRSLNGEQGHYEGLYTSETGTKNPWVRADLFPIFAGDKIQSGFAILEDISLAKQADEEKARLEDQYRQAQKVEALGRLAAGVAHDMNNLLTPILGYAGMLADDFSSDDRRKRYAEQILKAGYRSRDLVSHLLAFGRKQILEYKPLDLNRTIKGFEKLLRLTIREDIEIKTIPAPDILTLKADIGQIEQVIMNLAVNAQDAMPNGGTLTLKTAMVEIDQKSASIDFDTRPGLYVMLEVMDTGCGMDEKILEHIFEPFFSTKGEQGTGMGLATVYGIVKQHQGNILVTSKPHKGTTIKVYLPVFEQEQAKTDVIEESIKDLNGSETILLVEDNEQVRNFGHTALIQRGYKVLVTNNGANALKILESHDNFLHLLLTDVIMPGINGKDLFTLAEQKQPNLKVLYMSGYTGDIIGQHGILDKGVQFIRKPFCASELATKVREVLDLP